MRDDDHFYIVLFSNLNQTHCTVVACDSEWVTVTFYSASWISTKVVSLQHCLVLTWLVPCETAAVMVSFVYTIQPCAMSHHFILSHICRVHACLGVTHCLHFWQNDRDLLHATAVTQGWNRYQTKCQHKKLTQEKKILPVLLLLTHPSNGRSVQRQCTRMCMQTDTSQPAAHSPWSTCWHHTPSFATPGSGTSTVIQTWTQQWQSRPSKYLSSRPAHNSH